MQATVSISWVQTVLAEAQRQGVATGPLLAAAGIAPAALDLERWPIDHITRLWRAATRLTQDPGFGLKAGSQVGPASFNVVGFVLQSAATLRQAIVAAQKYQSLISDGGRLQLLPVDEACWLVYHPQQGDLAYSPQQIEAVLAALIAASRWATGQALRPKLTRLSHAAQGPLQGYQQVFGRRVEFHGAFNGLLIDEALLDRPIPQASPQLARLHEAYAASQLQALSAGQRLDGLVRSWLAQHLGPQMPQRAQAAKALGMSPRTLTRRLQLLQTHYSALLDEARRDRALNLVGGTDLGFGDIAHQLGFADLSPFYRAFTRWCGMTPGQWRHRARAADAALPARQGQGSENPG